MAYVEGRRLDVWAQEENPDARAVAEKVLGVARALAEIHRAGVIHRDLKEANIIVRSSDGEAVVVDFGVSGGPNTARVTLGVLPPCVGATEAEQAEATLDHVPEPPHVINPRVPEATSAICMKLLEKLPENRYRDAATLGVAVEEELARAGGGWSVPLCDFHAPHNIIETEATGVETQGTFTLKMWNADGTRSIILTGVTFL